MDRSYGTTFLYLWKLQILSLSLKLNRNLIFLPCFLNFICLMIFWFYWCYSFFWFYCICTAPRSAAVVFIGAWMNEWMNPAVLWPVSFKACGFSQQYLLLIFRQCDLHVYHRSMRGKQCHDDKWVQIHSSVSDKNIINTDSHSAQCFFLLLVVHHVCLKTYRDSFCNTVWTASQHNEKVQTNLWCMVIS